MTDAPTDPRSSASAPTVRRAPLIGLTGAPAAGKSTVAALLREAGCAVVDVDALGHRALAVPAVRDRVVDILGESVLDGSGALDRRAVARVVFADPEALRRVEDVVHPRVRGMLRDEVEAARDAGARAVVLDVALLFEGDLASACDLTVAVDAPEHTRVARAAARGWDEDELRRRQAGQLAPDEKRARADRILVNDGDVARLRERALALLADVAPARSGNE